MFEILVTLLTAGISSFNGIWPSTQDTSFYAAFGLTADTVEVREVATSTETIFVGDVMLARDIESLLAQDTRYPFSYIESALEADFVFGNFEAAIPLVHTPTPDLTFSFSVDQSYVSRLSSAGFTHLSLANNHALDAGLAGFENSKVALGAHGLVPYGSPLGVSKESVTYVTNFAGEIEAHVALNAIGVSLSGDEIQALFETLNEESDTQIVFVHWGNEYKLSHGAAQRELAELLVEAGADLIIGHHPHVVQDIGLVNGVLVFYSLGNFVFDQYFSEAVQTGLIVSRVASEEGVAYTLTPVSSIASRGMPRVMAPYEKGIFLKALATRSDPRLAEEIVAGVITNIGN